MASNAKIESADRETIRQTQLERLQATINRAYRHVTFYRERFDENGLLPESIGSLEDLARIPFTTREDLLGHQPYGMFAVPLHDVLRLHPAAGAGGPIVVGYTQNDIATWRKMAVRACQSAGVTRSDVIQISLDYARDPGAMGAQSGAEALGASVIPASGLSPERQAEVMKNYRATVLVASPTQAMHLGRVLVDQPDTVTQTLRTALIVGEVWSQSMREEIESALHAEAFGSYGLSEMAVPGLATECDHHVGLHLSEDNVLAEIVDPETGKPVKDGEQGELVLTTLTREAVPILRYRTGDLTVLHTEPCACGRTLARFEPTHARSDDIEIVNGVRVSPDQIREIARELMTDAECSMQVHERGGEQSLEVRIAISPSWFGSEIRDLEMLREHIRLHIFEQLGLWATVRLVEPTRKKK